MCELSDGERQKVMVARALAQEPRLMILDEITVFLDLQRRVEIMRLLRRLAHEEGCTILLSIHDLDLALRSADRIWLMPTGSTPAADGAAAQIYAGALEDLVLTGAFEAVFLEKESRLTVMGGTSGLEVTSESCKTVWVLRWEDVISRHYSPGETARAVRFGDGHA
jgi:iron complex transport system ATP-binding protein